MGRRGVGPAKHGRQQPPGYVARGSYIDIEPSVVIVISPAHSATRVTVDDVGRGCHVNEGTISIVPVQPILTDIDGDVQVEIAVVIVISPGYAFVYTGRRGAERRRCI